MAVGIDTMVLIWAIPHAPRKGKQKTSQNVQDMQQRSRILLHELQRDGETIIVLHVTVSEWLRGVDPGQHGAFLAELDEQFELALFDMPSAALAAKIHIDAEANPPPKEEGEAATRACVKADVMIVATAKTAGATTFYSHEARVRHYAELAGMVAKDLPKQGSHLFTKEGNGDNARQEEVTEPSPLLPRPWVMASSHVLISGSPSSR